jgi:hypothetical protein
MITWALSVAGLSTIYLFSLLSGWRWWLHSNKYEHARHNTFTKTDLAVTAVFGEELLELVNSIDL